MQLSSIKYWAKICLCALFLETVAIIFVAISAYYVFSIGKKDEISAFYTTLIMFIIGYIIVCIFSILLLVKNKNDIKTDKTYKYQAIFGLIPIANIASVYWLIRLIQIKVVDFSNEPKL